MGKKRKTDTAADRHKLPKKTLRLHPVYGELLDRIARTEDRTQTAIVLRALRLYAEANNYPWPVLPRDEDPAD